MGCEAKKNINIPLLLKRAQRIFNLYIRLRDTKARDSKCITCGEIKHFHEMTAGHYMGISGHSATRFNEENVWAQCIDCNHIHHGRTAEFRIALYKMLGAEKLAALEQAAIVPYKWRKDEIVEITKKYKSKIQELGI